MDISRFVKNIVLHNYFLRELFFFLTGKKLNCKKIDKKIDKLQVQGRFNKKEDELIVSLTTYGNRIYKLKYTLYSLIEQTIQPSKILVWLSENEFSNQSIPVDLKMFKNYGVEFCYTDDVKSYKKLVPTLLQYPTKCVVTADDDLYYKKDWLEKLWVQHQKYPNDIIAHIAHKVTFAKNDCVNPYKEWLKNIKKEKGLLFPTSGGGVLYTNKSLFRDVVKKELFTKLSPTADDVWFFFMGYLMKQKVRLVERPYTRWVYVDIYKEYGLNDSDTLQSINIEHNMNDKQIRNVMQFYGITDNELLEYSRIN